MKAKIGGFLHLCIGEEATVVGATSVLADQDYLISTYREHGQAIARGTDPKAVMAELFGRETGTSHGRGGSMHLFDYERRFMGGYGIVGGNLPLAAGFALASDYRGEDSVTLCMFGDGASNQGTFGETMNLAALWKLPVVFMVINNQYGMGTAIERHSAVTDLSQKAECLGVPGERVDGMDVLAVRECVAEHLRLAREERQPTLVEALTYRFRGHSAADPEVYRTKEEVQQWRERDPIVTYGDLLKEAGIVDDEKIEAIDRKALEVVDEAVEFADASPEPRSSRSTTTSTCSASRSRAGMRSTSARPRSTAARTSARSASAVRRTTSPRPAPPTRAWATCSGASASRRRSRARRTQAQSSRRATGRREGDLPLVAVDALPRGAQPRLARGDGARRGRLPDGRGHRRLPGSVQGDAGTAGGVRREARARHADLGEHDRRHGRRRGDDRACARWSRS